MENTVSETTMEEIIAPTVTEEIIALFAKKLREDEKSRATQEKYLRDVRAFAAYLGSRELNKENAIAYKQKLIDGDYAPRSINSMLASLNSLFVFLGRSELRVKALRHQREIFCPEDKELTRAEYERLCRAAEEQNDRRLSLLLQTICGTGIRVSELPFVTVEAARRGEATVRCKGKTRTVFLVRELRRKLLSYAAARGICAGSIFITKSGRPLGRTAIWREMKRLCKTAHVNPRKVFPHNLRHLFARVFYALNKDITKLADLLGHGSINTTRIYVIASGSEHRHHMEQMRLIL